MKKVRYFIFAVLIAMLPAVLVLSMNDRNSARQEVIAYTEYLYFNWIDYPKTAVRLDSIPAEVNRELFSWFGYDKNGVPVKEFYTNVNFKYDGTFLLNKSYIGIPFEQNGETFYRRIFVEGNQVIGCSGSLWDQRIEES